MNSYANWQSAWTTTDRFARTSFNMTPFAMRTGWGREPELVTIERFERRRDPTVRRDCNPSVPQAPGRRIRSSLPFGNAKHVATINQYS